MTLTIPSELKYRRLYLQKKLWDRRKQLVAAYKSEDIKRISRAKLSLARVLHELAESPELGLPRPFNWGGLEIVYKNNFDNSITWVQCLSTKSDMHKVAVLLERSVFDVQIRML